MCSLPEIFTSTEASEGRDDKLKMVGALRLRAAPLASMSSIDNGGLNYKPRLNLRFNSNRRIFTALCIGQSPPSDSSVLTTSVGTASTSPVHLSQWTFTNRHIQILNFAACAAAVSATWLFCSAIPTLLAFKTAAESLEKLMDVTREELPGTMAAIRLSGMEISDLTMELSDLGQQFTQGVRNSTQAVRLAEERLRKLTTMNQSGHNANGEQSKRTSGS